MSLQPFSLLLIFFFSYFLLALSFPSPDRHSVAKITVWIMCIHILLTHFLRIYSIFNLTLALNHWSLDSFVAVISGDDQKAVFSIHRQSPTTETKINNCEWNVLKETAINMYRIKYGSSCAIIIIGGHRWWMKLWLWSIVRYSWSKTIINGCSKPHSRVLFHSSMIHNGKKKLRTTSIAIIDANTHKCKIIARWAHELHERNPTFEHFKRVENPKR